LNPNYAVGHQWYGEYLAARGRHEEAIAAIQRALELDPLSLIIHATLGRHGYFFARQYEQAAEQLLKTLEMDADFWVAHHFLGWVYTCLGKLEEALTAYETARCLNGNLETLAGLGYVHGRAGRRAEALALLDELRQLSARCYVSPMLSALIWTGLGDNDQAFAWLNRAVADRSQWLSEILVDSFFDPLRPDPRFQDLLRQVNLLP
jgi:Flp pilus assembly protein TadD